jgi:hypothetical protein
MQTGRPKALGCPKCAGKQRSLDCADERSDRDRQSRRYSRFGASNGCDTRRATGGIGISPSLCRRHQTLCGRTPMHPSDRPQIARPAECLNDRERPARKRIPGLCALALAAAAFPLTLTACGRGPQVSGPQAFPDPPGLFTGPEDAVMVAALPHIGAQVTARRHGPERDAPSH